MRMLRRDIKPENIFLTTDLRFKLGDFGLAIKADEELPFTRSGTLDYMAPEVRFLPMHMMVSHPLHTFLTP
jgi:serine/threonine protein kinase